MSREILNALINNNMEAPASISLVDRIRSLLRETLLSTANTTKDEAK